ncbi:protein FAR1-RELATED SEQUENCE 9-like [Spinacia oleracea]|uniref:Protein FAR1-RELATED SEQUENCE n=1 Tax=Spinacia oleracea TaxID=3562 RepID=A0A9R0IM64_SPIOL|nr:protein FAR1-RELATED SEQUENCE 9-like [Spinacia oleracea]
MAEFLAFPLFPPLKLEVSVSYSIMLISEMEGSGAEIGEGEVEGEEVEDFICRYEPQSSSDKEEGGEDCFTTPKKRTVVTAYGEEEEVLELKVGMVFSGWEEIEQQFRGYAKQKGFGVARRCGSLKSADKDKGIGKEKRNCLWTCECYGVPERRRKVTGDKVASDSQLHEVIGSGFLRDHPHVLIQANVCSKSGMSVAQTYDLMAVQRNGRGKMPFLRKDLNDVVGKERKARTSGGDAKDVLWVDARSRAAYEEFGDVFCFDTTYLTNKYKMPFANFVGVNHHGQSILLGCALVSHENSDTFEWIFGNWLECMGGKAPIGILTDQDPAMRRALRSTMSDTCHRRCIWHILQKFSRKLGTHLEYPDLKVDLERAIYDSLTCDEFELNWATVMERYQVDDDWLEGLYAERNMWVPAYVKHLFWASMKTTQRVESINSFFDQFVHKHTHLYEFVEAYCEAMEERENEESMVDTNTARNLRQIVTCFPAEELFQKIYTDAKFHEVQRECSRVLYVRCLNKKMLDESVEEYKLEDRVWIKPKHARKEIVTKHKTKSVAMYNYVTKETSCDCKHFECHGIRCRHMILVYDLNNKTEVSGKYILRRWRKDVKRKHTKVKVMYHDRLKIEVGLMVLFEPLLSKAASYKESMDVVVEISHLLAMRLDEKIAMLDRQRQNEDVGVGTPSSVCLEKGGTELTPSFVGQLQPIGVRCTMVFDSPQTNEHEGSCADGGGGVVYQAALGVYLATLLGVYQEASMIE